jgi:cytochrome c-type biogenesis protein CcmE
MQSQKVSFLLGGFLLAVGLVYLIYAATQGGKVYYLTVEEFLQQPAAFSGQGMRIAGKVAPGSIQRKTAVREVLFAVQGTSAKVQLAVSYKGSIPDTLRDGASVVLEGKYNPQQQIFTAATLMTACPSKYESKLAEPQGTTPHP